MLPPRLSLALVAVWSLIIDGQPKERALEHWSLSRLDEGTRLISVMHFMLDSVSRVQHDSCMYSPVGTTLDYRALSQWEVWYC